MKSSSSAQNSEPDIMLTAAGRDYFQITESSRSKLTAARKLAEKGRRLLARARRKRG